METQRTHYRTTVRTPIVPDYRPLDESGAGATLEAPAELTAAVHIDGDAGLGLVELDMRLVDGRYRITRLTATPPADGFLDIEAVRALNYSTYITDALAGTVVARTRQGDTYTAERPMTNPDPLWPVALHYALTRALGGNPTAAVAERFDISYEAAAQRVKRARDKGFLAVTTRGKAR